MNNTGSGIVKVCLLFLTSFALGYLYRGVTVPSGNTCMTLYDASMNRRDAYLSFPTKVAKQNGSNLHLVATGVSPLRDVKRYNYFVVNDDPDAAARLETVLSRLSAEIKQYMAAKTGISLDDQGYQFVWPPTMSVKERWAMVIDYMRELGYEQRLPDVVGIGIMKSGTNAFYQYLSEHPQIAPSIETEVRYFDIHYSKGLEYYRANMGFSRINQRNMEKSPPYIFLKNGPEIFKKDLPENVKFLLCVRDPVERLISQFRHYSEDEIYCLTNGGGKREEAMAETAESQGRKLAKLIFTPDGRVRSKQFLVDMSTYSKHLKRWLEYFSPDRFFIVSHERVNKDLYTELRKLEDFLGLGPFYERKMFYYDEKRHVPCMYSNCPQNTTPGRGILAKAKLRPDEIKKLREFFRPYNQEFSRLTRMNFTWTDL